MINLTSSKKYSLLLTIALLMATFAAVGSVTMVAPASAQTTTDWPKFHNDAANTGVSASRGPDKFVVGWRYYTGRPVESSPAVVGGRVYIGSNDGNLYCLDGATGALVWKYKTGGGVRSSPTVADGKVYFGSGDTYVYCLTTDGTLVWKYQTGDMVVSYPNVVGGKVYIGSRDSYVYCLYANNGTMFWRFKTGAGIWWVCPAVVNNRVYVGSADSYWYCLNAATGAQIWRYQTGTGIYQSSAVVYGDRVYVGGDDERFRCLNATTGAFLWYFRTIEYDPGVESTYVESTPAVFGGKVYLAMEHRTFCLDAVTGKVIWVGITGFTVRSSPALSSNNRLYQGSDDRQVYIFDAATGAMLDSYQQFATVESSPAIADGKIYIGGGNGWVYCFVQSVPPVPTTISCSVFPTSTPIAGIGVSVSGFVFPGTYLGATVTLTYTKPDGTTITETTGTLPDGKYNKYFYPDVTGVWSVKAHFEGVDRWRESTSAAANFTVTGTAPKAKTSISVWVDPRSLTKNETTYVRGSITPAMSGITVTLTYFKPDLTTTTKTVTTGADGTYEDTIKPDALGTWGVVASWPGDATHEAGCSPETWFDVSAPLKGETAAPVVAAGVPTEVAYGLIVAVIIAIVAIALVIYIGRKK